MSLLLPRRAISRPERALNVIGTGSPITPGATMTKVPGTTGTTYAGGGVTSGAAWRLVAPADGRYSLKANIHFDVSEAVEVEFGFVVNGTATGSEHLRGFSPGASAESVAHLSDSLDLSAGDYVEPFCRCTASGTASISVNLAIGMGMEMVRQSAVAGASDLLSVAQSLGAVLLLDMYTVGAYALSGSDIVSVDNRITDVTISAGGTPQYNAAGFNAGPAAILNGSTDLFSGTEAAVYSAFADDNDFTLIIAAQLDVPDANRETFSVGDSAGLTPYLRTGTSTTAGGRRHMTFISDGSAETIGVEDTTNADTSPHILEWTRSAGNATLLIDRAASGITGIPCAPTSSNLTPNKWTWGCLGRSTNALFHDGPSSLVIAFPTALSAGDKDTLYTAIAAHHAALAGLLP